MTNCNNYLQVTMFVQKRGGILLDTLQLPMSLWQTMWWKGGEVEKQNDTCTAERRDRWVWEKALVDRGAVHCPEGSVRWDLCCCCRCFLKIKQLKNLRMRLQGRRVDMEGLGNEWDWSAWCEIPKVSIQSYVFLKENDKNIFVTL